MASWWKKTQEQQGKNNSNLQSCCSFVKLCKTRESIYLCIFMICTALHISLSKTIKTFVAILFHKCSKYNMHTQCIIWDVHATKKIFSETPRGQNWPKVKKPQQLSAFIFSIKAFLCFSTFPHRHCQLDQDLCLLIWRGWNEPNTIKYDSPAQMNRVVSFAATRWQQHTAI